MLLIATSLRPSPIHGIGVFSEEFVPAGKVIWMWHDYVDQVINPLYVNRLPPTCQEYFKRYSWMEADGYYRMGIDNEKYINHSYSPNCGEFVYDRDLDTDVGISVVDINIGDEITQDYSTFDFNFGKPEFGYDWDVYESKEEK